MNKNEMREVIMMNLLTKKEIEEALEYCISQVDKGMRQFHDGYFPRSSSNNCYIGGPQGGWTEGFWTGMQWLAYEMTGDEVYRKACEAQVGTFEARIQNKHGLNHHDMGFLYSLSCVAAYKLTGDEKAKNTALKSADVLYGRFQKKGGYIKAWGNMENEIENRVIVDCYLNLPLLFWASEVTNNPQYRDVAVSHLEATVDVLIRPDGRAYHTYRMDLKNGNPVMPVTGQGYSAESVWSRGQAWVIYGLALAYRYTGNEHYAEIQKKAARKFLELLPEDHVPAWDMVFTDTRTLKDTSAAVIAVCGLLEMNRLLGNHEEAHVWEQKAHEMLRVLIAEHTTKDLKIDTSAVLMHGTGAAMAENSSNEPLIFVDYFYMEALVRLLKPDWVCYW